jgi:protein-disulfide isomerase-like protein with CxxC motif
MQRHTLRCRIDRLCSRALLFLAVFTLLLSGSVPPARGAGTSQTQANAQLNQTSSDQTLGLYQSIPGLTSQQIDYGRAAIPRMNYNAQRIFRKICALPGVTFEHARQAIDLLGRERFTFEQVQTFEALAGLDTVDIKIGMASLATVKNIGFEAGRSFRKYVGMEGVTANVAMSMIPMFNNMDDYNNRAAQAFFAVKGMRVDLAQKGMPALMRLRNNQAKAAETYAKVPGMDPETMFDGLELLQKLYQDDAWNARCLFTDKSLTPRDAWNWLVSYFALPTNLQETQYDKLDSHQKTVLLQGLYEGGTEIIWKINNLHAVTDANGYEISEAALNSYSMQQLQAKFNELVPSVRERFSGFASAGRGQAIAMLKQATSAARMQTARDLTVANAYAVMAQGSELYDSSFREILVPVFQARINSRNQGDLLAFLKSIDPGNRLVSDFISSCAQKGKLTAFFPSDAGKQKEILSLVASSAFQNEDSILLFSATLSHLLKVLTPEARSHLIGLMAQNSDAENAAFSKLVTVILQYYLQTYPELLGPADRTLISRLIVRHGAVNLDRYQVTPFNEWKQDGRLGSVSMFHPDDDGRQSFISNANLLLNSGYQMVPSRQYSVGSVPPALPQGTGLASLFQSMRTRHFAVAFVKKVGDVTIVHTQFVYSDMENQMEMLNRFIHSKDEMLAQRGHSYWRSEQIIDPLTKLIEEGRVTEADLRGKQRFLSLGSCGGVKVYTNLTRLFASSVDILATIGTGLALINDPYNKMFFEIIASNPSTISWKGVAQQSSSIFQGERGQDYLLPGSLTAILHKILDETQQASGTATKSRFERPQG